MTKQEEIDWIKQELIDLQLAYQVGAISKSQLKKGKAHYYNLSREVYLKHESAENLTTPENKVS